MANSRRLTRREVYRAYSTALCVDIGETDVSEQLLFHIATEVVGEGVAGTRSCDRAEGLQRLRRLRDDLDEMLTELDGA